MRLTQRGAIDFIRDIDFPCGFLGNSRTDSFFLVFYKDLVGTILPRGDRQPLFFKETKPFRTVRNLVSPSRMAGRNKILLLFKRFTHQQQPFSVRFTACHNEPEIDSPARKPASRCRETAKITPSLGEEPFF